MRRVSLVVCVTVLLLFILSLGVYAQDMGEMFDEQLEASGASELFDALPSETRDLLRRLGIDGLTWEALSQLNPQTVLSFLRDVLTDQVSSCSAAWAAIGTLLILGVFSALQTQGQERTTLFRAVGVLAVVTPLLVPLWQVLGRVQASADSASVFSLSFAPVYAATLVAQGRTASAVSYQTMMIAAAEGITLLVCRVIVPLMSVSVSLGITGAIDPSNRLGEVGGMVNKVSTWMLTGALTVFVALLSFQSVLSASADSVGGRMLRFSVAGFVPIVGGSLSEALYTLRGCLSVLRGTVGGFGILCAVLIALPTLAECVVWNIVLFFVKTVAELFSFSAVASVVAVMKGVLRIAMAVLSSSALLMIISVTLVAAGGAR